MIKKIFLYFILCILSYSLQAKENIDIRYDGIYLEDITMSQLDMLYNDYNYKDYIYIKDWKYPPIFMTTLPIDFHKITDSQKRNKLFLQMLVPLSLKVNNEIIAERYELEEIIKEFNKSQELSEQQIKTIEDKAIKYDIFTRQKGTRRYTLILNQLKEKVDVVPPSILIASAAIESNWGTNRPVRLANSLYRELVWYTTEGLEPLDETEDKSYRYKIFNSLYDSMVSYANKINSSINYQQFRTARAQIRSKEVPLLGRNIAHTMYFDSNLQNYAGLLDYTITFYELTNIDEATLSPLYLPETTKK